MLHQLMTGHLIAAGREAKALCLLLLGERLRKGFPREISGKNEQFFDETEYIQHKKALRSYACL
jgi:hypothetical protein